MFDYYERFTERARTIASGAEKYARYFDSDLVGTEHLLLALALSEESLPQRILASEGYGASKICEYLSEGIEHHAGQIPFSLGAEKALELALSEALAHGGKEVDDIDILLSILRLNDDSTAVTMLQKLNNGDSAVDSLREAIARQLAPVITARVETPPKDEDYIVIKLPIPKAIAAISDDRVSLVKKIVRNLTGMTFDEMQKILQLVKLPADKRRKLLKAIP